MDKEIIANIKSLGLDMINEARSGHPGIVLSAAPILYTLYAKHLNVFPSDTNFYNRDRFIMSAGHGSTLLYATLFMCGFQIQLDDLKKFRQIDSITPGHPEYGITPGVECSTGPLGQGLASSVGIALGEKILKNCSSKTDFKTYVLVSDGDLMEGIGYEACSLAGQWQLDNLIILYDSNQMTLDGSTDYSFKEDTLKRFEAMGFKTYVVEDGNDLDLLNKTIEQARKSDKPTFIEVRTVLGYGSLLEGNHTIHGKPLTDEDIKQLKKKLNIPDEPFYVNVEAKKQMMKMIYERVYPVYQKTKDYVPYESGEVNIIDSIINLPSEDEATRMTNQNIINQIAKLDPMFIGGSADLSSSTKTYLMDMGDIKGTDYSGRNIWFGVREHAMGAILNGLSLLGFHPFGSTFLSFSDYLKPAMRMSALMHLPVTYIFTHDSVLVGEDGPTHQPIEQIATLRSMPNMDVYRPADAKELVGCWENIFKRGNPSALLLSRTSLPQHLNTDSVKTLKGGYIVSDSDNLDAIIIATGSELKIALQLKNELTDYHLRIVSMPSKEIFLSQDKEYRDEVLKPVKTVVIEASSSYGWHDIADWTICLDQFGYSGKKEDVLVKLNYDYDSIKKQLLDILKP